VRSLMCPRVGTDRADLRQSPPRENASVTPETTTSGLLPPRWKTVGRVRTSLEQVQSVEKTRWQLSQVAQCGRVMLINLVSRRVVDRLVRESGVRSEWFQVFGTRFYDESDLSQVELDQSRRFPAWRQRTGSAVLDVSEGVNRPGGPQAVTTPSR